LIAICALIAKQLRAASLETARSTTLFAFVRHRDQVTAAVAENQAKFGCIFHTKLWPDLKQMVNAVIVIVQQ
jgi:hypothetical protein